MYGHLCQAGKSRKIESQSGRLSWTHRRRAERTLYDSDTLSKATGEEDKTHIANLFFCPGFLVISLSKVLRTKQHERITCQTGWKHRAITHANSPGAASWSRRPTQAWALPPSARVSRWKPSWNAAPSPCALRAERQTPSLQERGIPRSPAPLAKPASLGLEPEFDCATKFFVCLRCV